jgi:integrase
MRERSGILRPYEKEKESSSGSVRPKGRLERWASEGSKDDRQGAQRERFQSGDCEMAETPKGDFKVTERKAMIYKRNDIYWYNFWFNGHHVQASTKQKNARSARQMEAAHKTRLAKGEVGIEERKPAPTLKGFSERFKQYIEVRSADKPATIEFYKSKLGRLLEFEALANAKLDSIDEGLIEKYVQMRRKKKLSPASVNRELATLRRMLNLARQWKLIVSLPEIKMLPGERVREFVLSYDQEQNYLDFAPQPLRDVALLILDTGLRIGEAVNLEWSDIVLEPVGNARYGYLRVRKGKSQNAKRNISLTARVRQMLINRHSEVTYVFQGKTEGSFLATSLNHQHSAVRTSLKLSQEFVLHSLRHTMLTRLGEAGVDAFTIMRIAGHSSITVSQGYVHPSPEALERAFEKLENLNANSGQRFEATTIPTTAGMEPTTLLPVSIS